MAVATYTALQQAILRKTLLAEAQVQDAAGTDPALYEEQLIERAETSTQAALLISQIVYGKVPVDAAKLDSLTAFAQSQFDAYSAKGVARPELGPYEALGVGFSNTPQFAAMLAAAGGSDGQFVTNVYIAAFGVGPTQPQVQHFIDQINYFKGIYTAAGVPAATASLQAHGAVLGQIVGEAATIEGSTLDNLAEGWLHAAADGTAVFNAPIQDSQVPEAPDPGTLPQTLVLTTGIDVIGPTADFPLGADDTVIGDGQSIQSNDTVNLGDGFDKANLVILPTSMAQLLNIYKLNLTSVEQVNVSVGSVGFGAGIPIQLSANNWTGVEEFWLRHSDLTVGASRPLFVNDIQLNMALGFDDFQGDAQYQYDNGGLGANATVNVILQNASDVNLATQTDAADDEIGRLNLTILGAGNDIDLDLRTNGGGNSSDGLSQLFLLGDGNITLNETEFDSLTVLNGSAHTGDWSIHIPNSTAALAAIGGSGANYLDFNSGDGTFTTADSFDGGGGNDSLEVDANDAQDATSANVSGVEHLVVSDSLTATRIYTNSAGFTDIILLNQTTNDGDLQLNGFTSIIVNADQNGLLDVNATSATIAFGQGGDIQGELNIAGVGSATLVYNGNGVAEIDELTIDFSDADPFTADEHLASLNFSGSGNFEIGQGAGSIDGEIGLVDLSAASGRFIMIAGDDFGPGSDFLVGSLDGGSQIRLDVDGEAAITKNELVFASAGLNGTVQIFNFDIVDFAGEVTHDVLDFGALGISNLDELDITFSGGNTNITSNTGAFAGTIQLVGVNLTSAIGGPDSAIDFDGLVN